MAVFLVGFIGIALASTPNSVASTETEYVLDLVNLLDDAGGYLTQARLALNLCLANQEACAANSQPFQDQIDDARIGVDGVKERVGQLEVPPKYVEVQGIAIESLANISTALDLLNQGLESFDPSYMELASVHLDSARLQIATIYDRLQNLPPSSDSNLGAILWPVVAALAILVSVNLIYLARSTRRDTRTRKRIASMCPSCGAQMTNFESYPLKTVEAWMATHTSAYHVRGARPTR